MALHSWELPERQWDNVAPEINDLLAESEPEADFDYESLSRRAAAELLCEQILDLKQNGKISAKAACVLAFFATKAGVKDSPELCKVAKPPGLQTGKYSRQFDTVFSHPDTEGFEYVKTPASSRVELGRIIMDTPVAPPHEALVIEWRLRKAHLREKLAVAKLPRKYHSHPVVTGAPDGAFVWPIALYMDGVQFTREDTVLGVWVVCLLTGRRWLAFVIRKAEMCGCGCHGWCSLRNLFAALAHSLRALARGHYLHDGPDGAPLGDAALAYAGDALGFRAAVVCVKGDWMEFATTLGFPTWSSALSPCMMCKAPLSEAYSITGMSVLGTPWGAKDYAWYDAACKKCEKHVVLDEEAYRSVRASLFYDKRKHGARGRALAVDVPELGLQAGDRLEPSATVQDVGAGFDLSNPGRATFWRIPEAPETHHRNPLVDEELGLGPDSLVVDELHALSHGVFKYFLQDFTWTCFEANIWQIRELGAEAQLVSNCRRHRTELFEWYKRETLAGREHARVQDFTSAMVGSSAKRDMRLHAAEMNGFLHFSGDLIRRFRHALPNAAHWDRAQKGLAAMHRMIRASADVFDAAECQELAMGHLRIKYIHKYIDR